MDQISAFANDRRTEGFADSTIATYTRMLKLVPFELPGTVREVKDHLGVRRQTVSAASLVVETRALKSFSSWWADEHAADDPLSGLKFPKAPMPPPGRIASDDDIRRVLGKLKNWNQHQDNVRDYALIELFRFTGMRRSEAARLTVTDVDFETMRLTVVAGKNHEPRVIPLHPRLAKSLRRYLNQREYHRYTDRPELWLGVRGPLQANAIDRVLRRVSAVADVVPGLKTHEFRRRLAKVWIQNGGSDDLLMLVAGWRSATMPARYRQEARSELAEAQYAQVFPDEPIGRTKPGPKPKD